MNDRWILALAFAALFAIVFVRRLRRSFGPQRLRPVGLVFVVGLMSAIAVVMSILSRTPWGFHASGVAVGVLLAAWALGRTRFGVDPAGRFYVPDGVTGLIVLGLFFVRVSMRLWGIAGPLDRLDDVTNAASGGFAAATSNPGTMVALFVLLGYYVAYYAGVLFRGTRLASPTP